MNFRSILLRSVLSALGVYLYIALLTGLAQNTLFETQPPWWLAASLFLTVFVVSALITGTLVLLKPITLYAEGQRRDAFRLLMGTIAALAVTAVLVAVVLALYLR